MGKVLVLMNDILDGTKEGPVAQRLFEQGHEVVVVGVSGCPAIGKVHSSFPELSVRNADQFDLHVFNPDVVLATMVKVEDLQDLLRECRGEDIPIVMVQDRPDVRLGHYPYVPADAICMTDGGSARRARKHWGLSAKKILMPRTGAPHMDAFSQEIQGVYAAVRERKPMGDPEDVRSLAGIPKDATVIHFAADKVGGAQAGEAWLRVCKDLVEDGAWVYPSIHPVASDDEKKAFTGLFDGMDRVIWDFTLASRILAADVTIASIASGIPGQTSMCDRTPIAWAGETEIGAMRAVSGPDAQPEEDPLVTGGFVALARDEDELAERLKQALDGRLALNRLPEPSGDATEEVAKIVTAFL